MLNVNEPDEEHKTDNIVAEENNKENKKSKRKKDKISLEDGKSYEKIGKKTKKSKSKKSKENKDYEETAGISTPSKEILPSRDLNFDIENNVPDQLPTSSKELAKDKTVKVLYEIKQLEYDTSKIILLLSFINLSENVLKELIFNVMDSLALQLERRVSNILFRF